MDGLYVFNNPWAVQSMEKHTTYCAMMQLGHADPRDVDDPAEGVRADARPRADAQALREAVRPRRRSASKLGYPMFMKPYDGGGWQGVIAHRRRGGAAHALRGERQAASCTCRRRSQPFDRFVRCIGLGPQTALVRYDPTRRSTIATRWTKDFVTADEARAARATPRSRSTRSSAGTSTRARRCARTASGTRSTSRTRAPTRRSRRCTTTSRGW